MLYLYILKNNLSLTFNYTYEMLSNQSSKPKTYCRFVSAKIEIISKEDLICCQLP